MKPEQPEIFAVGDRVKFLRLNEDMTAGDVDDETLGAGVVIAVRVAPADVLMRETYKSLRDDPVTKDFLADSLAQMREALLSGQLRGLMWDAIEVQLDIGVTVEMPPAALRKVAAELQS
jgi:hypothetical protein